MTTGSGGQVPEGHKKKSLLRTLHEEDLGMRNRANTSVISGVKTKTRVGHMFFFRDRKKDGAESMNPGGGGKGEKGGGGGLQATGGIDK